MFDISWGKLVIIGVVALLVIGPKELPAVLRQLGQWMTKIRRMASEFQGQFQEAMREAEMADLKKQFDETTSSIKSTLRYRPSIKNELEKMIQDPMAASTPSSTTDARRAIRLRPRRDASRRAADRSGRARHRAGRASGGRPVGPDAGPAAAARDQGFRRRVGRAAAPSPHLRPHRPSRSLLPRPREARRHEATDDDEKEIEATKAPLMEHLIELRSRLIKALIAFFLTFIVCFFFAGRSTTC